MHHPHGNGGHDHRKHQPGQQHQQTLHHGIHDGAGSFPIHRILHGVHQFPVQHQSRLAHHGQHHGRRSQELRKCALATPAQRQGPDSTCNEQHDQCHHTGFGKCDDVACTAQHSTVVDGDHAKSLGQGHPGGLLQGGNGL